MIQLLTVVINWHFLFECVMLCVFLHHLSGFLPRRSCVSTLMCLTDCLVASVLYIHTCPTFHLARLFLALVQAFHPSSTV